MTTKSLVATKGEKGRRNLISSVAKDTRGEAPCYRLLIKLIGENAEKYWFLEFSADGFLEGF